MARNRQKRRVKSKKKSSVYHGDLSEPGSQRVQQENADEANLDQHRESDQVGGKQSYYCDIPNCPKTYTTMGGVNAHKLRDHEGRRYLCDVPDCLLYFVSPSEQREHKRACHERRELYCRFPGCSKSFIYRHRLKRHQKSVHGKILYSCEQDGCGESFNNVISLRSHLALDHKRHPEGKSLRVRYYCVVAGCNESYDELRDMQRHRKVVHEGQPEDEVEKVAHEGQPEDPVENELDRQIDSDQGQSRNRHTCPYKGCKGRFDSRERLRRHKVTVHEGQLFTCGYSGCGAEYTYSTDLQTNQKIAHGTVIYPFPCPRDDCDEAFMALEELKYHLRADHKEKKYHCSFNQCSEPFISPEALQGHCLRVHKERCTEFPCPYDGCSESYLSGGGLRYHLRTYHRETPQLQLPCSYDGCKSVFDTHIKLQNHEEGHRGETLRCEHDGCNYSTVWPRKLRIHTRDVHLKRFRCTHKDCGRSFAERLLLKEHVEGVHENVRRPCPVPGCKETFQSPRSIPRHVKIVHGTQERIKCPKSGCKQTFPNQKELDYHLNQHGKTKCESCDYTCEDTSRLLHHSFHHHDQKDLLIFPPQPRMDVSQINDGISLSPAEAKAYCEKSRQAEVEIQDPLPNDSTVEEQNTSRENHWFHWLDVSATGSQCFGPSPRRSPQPCPFSITITKDTAIMFSQMRQRKFRLYLVLRLSPRCIHCRLLAYQQSSVELPNNTKGNLCQFPNCRQQRWQGVGTLCVHHYGVWCWSSDLWKTIYRGIPDVPPGFAEKTPAYSKNFATKRYRLGQYPELSEMMSILSDTSPDAPRLYALDTEFRRVAKGLIKVTEAAIIDVRIGRIVVNAVLDERRIMEVSTKLGKFLSAQHQDPSAPSHVKTAYSVAGMAQQVEDYRIRASDVFVEFSTHKIKLLDLGNVHSTLKEHLGDDGLRLIPRLLAGIFSEEIPLPSGSLQRDPLVDFNHTAAVDALQLARLLRFAAELWKDPKDRQLPPDLFHGIQQLQSPNKIAVQSNTIDRYFKPINPNPEPEAGDDGSFTLPEELEDQDTLRYLIEDDILSDDQVVAGHESDEEDGFERWQDEEPDTNVIDSHDEDNSWVVSDSYTSEHEHDARHDNPSDMTASNQSGPKRKHKAADNQGDKKKRKMNQGEQRYRY
ncbi:hypothetical protein F5884DRAFT_830312 [Xylogone sp. PMI_703]|nr:hypothetical protein F5884DRAFT_830312 [Xylogone sp. PMI_703]